MDNVGKCFGLAFITFFLLYWFKVRIRVPKGYRLPPGPPRQFLIGNLLDIPFQKEWQTYYRWSKTYGDLTYLNICGTSVLLVNSHKLASELFDQRGTIYSDRYHSTMIIDLCGITNLVNMQPNENWRLQRLIFHRYFSKPAIVQYQGLIDKSAKKLLRHLYQTPDEFIHLSRHAIGALVMEMTYGIETLADNDPYIELAERAVALIGEVSLPGACLVDFFPILKYVPSWVPGAGFKKKAKQLNAVNKTMAIAPFTFVKNAIKAGNARSSIIGNFLEELESKESEIIKDEKTIQEMGAMIYLAAIDTTESAIQVFFLAMLLHPDVQKKAQKELDGLLAIRGSILPSFDDRNDLPYTDALCKEVLRWHPVVPLSFPHMLKEDDMIGEYFVPKGTIVMGNSWTLLHSESVYGDDVHTFKPERFLKPNASYPDAAFGFGRRICPGRHLADNILFVMVTHILYAFDITPHKGPTGEELPEIDAFISGLVSRPQPFKCKLTPRTPRLKTLLEQLSTIIDI